MLERTAAALAVIATVSIASASVPACAEEPAPALRELPKPSPGVGTGIRPKVEPPSKQRPAVVDVPLASAQAAARTFSRCVNSQNSTSPDCQRTLEKPQYVDGVPVSGHAQVTNTGAEITYVFGTPPNTVRVFCKGSKNENTDTGSAFSITMTCGDPQG
jgi:hypothetical protein